MSLAVSLLDWKEAWRLWMATQLSIRKLHQAAEASDHSINGRPAGSGSSKLWDGLLDSVALACRQAVLKSLRCAGAPGADQPFVKAAMRLFEELGIAGDYSSIRSLAVEFREADWARVSYKDHLRHDAKQQRAPVDGENSLSSSYPHENALRDFLNRTIVTPTGAATGRISRSAGATEEGLPSASILPFLFPTRPYSAQEVALYLPEECVFGSPVEAARNWATYVRAVRGVWVRSSLVDQISMPSGGSGGSEPPEGGEDVPPDPVHIGLRREPESILLGITSLGVSNATWSKGANGSPDLSAERYRQIVGLVNQAVHAKPRPTYLLLPELSLPERWLSTVSGLLQQSGINLIAGLDYQKYPPNYVDSSAVLILDDDRLGFRSTLQVRQTKTFPAPGEEQHLLEDFNLEWNEPTFRSTKPVYDHNGFHFGVLVCSELQNIDYRKKFQGRVDCVMVLSWNKDLETFSALVDSASLDVHSYVALVNNRRYGDSRVRSPSKLSFRRDVCRIRGGENDHVVVVKVDPRDLRKQQSRGKRWATASDQYKPAPEGFQMAKKRRRIPGT